MLELVSHLAFLFVSLWKTYTETCIHSSAFVWHNFVLLGNMKVIALTLIMKTWVQQHTHCCENGEHLWINPTPGKKITLRYDAIFHRRGKNAWSCLLSYLSTFVCCIVVHDRCVCTYGFVCVFVYACLGYTSAHLQSSNPVLTVMPQQLMRHR